MPNDFNKKQPSKTEQLIANIYSRQDGLERAMWSTSSFVTALAYLQEMDPKKLAELLTKDHQKVQEYSQKVNNEIAEIEKKIQEEKSGAENQPPKEDPANTKE